METAIKMEWHYGTVFIAWRLHLLQAELYLPLWVQESPSPMRLIESSFLFVTSGLLESTK